VTIDGCDFSYNYGSLGGIIGIYDYFYATITSNTFALNKANRGGLIYTSELSSNSKNSTLTFSNNDVHNHSSILQGGVFWISHSNLLLYISSSTFLRNYAPIGGVIYLQNIVYMYLYSNSLSENTGTDGTVLYSTASDALLKLELNTFIGYSSFNYTQV
jgi:hypothetical protein